MIKLSLRDGEMALSGAMTHRARKSYGKSLMHIEERSPVCMQIRTIFSVEEKMELSGSGQGSIGNCSYSLMV